MASLYEYATKEDVKGVSSLLKNISDAEIEAKISDQEVIINSWLNKRYVTPLSFIPDDIKLAVKYMTANTLIVEKYTTQANTGVLIESFKKQFYETAYSIIKELRNGSYKNPNLTPQPKENTNVSSWGYPEDQDLRTAYDNLQSNWKTVGW